MTCLICYSDSPLHYLECFHLLCEECTKKIDRCAECRNPFTQEFIMLYQIQNPEPEPEPEPDHTINQIPEFENNMDQMPELEYNMNLLNNIISDLEQNVAITNTQRTLYINYINNILTPNIFNIVNVCENQRLKNHIINIINETNNILNTNNFSEYNLSLINNMLNLLDNLIMDDNIYNHIKSYINSVKILF
jgi:hypothetical protein